MSLGLVADQAREEPLARACGAQLYDVVIVGLGLHSLSLLARAPNLLSRTLCLIDAGPESHGGSMSEFIVPTNSVARKFVEPFAASPVFARLFSIPGPARELLQTRTPVDCRRLGETLSALAVELRQAFPQVTILRETTVQSVRTSSGLPLMFETSRGTVAARAGVLATGRVEHLSLPLLRLGNRVVLSSDLLTGRVPAEDLLRKRIIQRVAILGGSHAAFSCLAVLIDAAERIGLSRCPTVDVIHRRPIALYYSSEYEAQRIPRTISERHFRRTQHICPETGAVFRDSGLRGRSQELFRRAEEGMLRGVRLVPTADAAAANFDGYDLIVQAFGAGPRVPALEVNGRCVWRGDGTDRFSTDEVGRVRVRSNPHLPLHALRVLPTARADKDRRPHVHDIHAAMGANVLAEFARDEDVRQMDIC